MDCDHDRSDVTPNKKNLLRVEPNDEVEDSKGHQDHQDHGIGLGAKIQQCSAPGQHMACNDVTRASLAPESFTVDIPRDTDCRKRIKPSSDARLVIEVAIPILVGRRECDTV